tara:strand:+ start:19593 stop:20693 length:1101 start_codon:yes stop_codon:yes gene_type:complete
VSNTLKYQIALSMVSGIGNIGAKKLIAYCGGAEAVFTEKKQHLLKIPGIGKKAVELIFASDTLKEAEEELRFIEENNIKAHFFLDDSYPRRLTHCDDGPIILYTKGKMDMNAEKMISVVGTRNATVKGKAFCESLIESLVEHQVTIVSGLAYGIDSVAHKTANKVGLQTIGVLGSGLNEIYPKSNYNFAQKMQENGGIASDYRSNTKLLPMHFAERNRIVAGMADAVIVIESSDKGGSLITADLANGYNRDVFAVPGRVDDSQSVGCNRLIKSHKAALLESYKDLEYIMGWEKQKPSKKTFQSQLFVDLSEEETQLIAAFGELEQTSLDILSLKANLPISKTTTLLLELEFKGLIKSLPGKVYQRV